MKLKLKMNFNNLGLTLLFIIKAMISEKVILEEINEIKENFLCEK